MNILIPLFSDLKSRWTFCLGPLSPTVVRADKLGSFYGDKVSGSQVPLTWYTWSPALGDWYADGASTLHRRMRPADLPPALRLAQVDEEIPITQYVWETLFGDRWVVSAAYSRRDDEWIVVGVEFDMVSELARVRARTNHDAWWARASVVTSRRRASCE